METPITEKIRDSYIQHGLDTEKLVFAMLLTKCISGKINPAKFTFEKMAKSIHKASMKNMCVNFDEGELLLQDMYEIHSVSGNRDDDGDLEVFINMLDTTTMEAHSVRVYQFPQLDWLLQIIDAVYDKCKLTLEIDEDEED